MKFKKLDWYIAKKFLETFFVTVMLFIVIIMVFDVAEKLDDFLEKSAPVGEIFTIYYLNFIPTLLNTFSPIFIFISVLYMTSRLASRTEIISMLAGGMSLRRILMPYMATAALLAMGSYMLNAWVIPITDKARVRFENAYMRDYYSQAKSTIFRQIKPGVILYMEYFNNNDSSGVGVTLEEYKGKELKSSLFGRFIRWSPEAKKWRLEMVWQRKFFASGNQQIQYQSMMDTMIAFNPEDFFFRIEDVQSLNQNELRSMIAKEKMRGSTNVELLQTELYRRYASPFSTFILVLIAVSVAGRKTRGGLGFSLGVGIFVILFFLFFSKYFVSLGNSGVIWPWLAVWLPNALFVPVAYLFYRFAQQ
jgi:lipopolysaccharide export system permease protein